LTDQQLRWPAPATRLYSRAAARYISNHPSGEMLLRSDAAIGGFPADRILLPADAVPPTTRLTRSVIGRGLRSLVASSSAPLRLATAVAILTGLLSLLYSLYVVIVYFVVSDVAAGWTTLSLQTAGMMFLLSVMLAILSEYVIAIYHSLAPRRRHVVARELRSQRHRHSGRINVVDAEGAFHLGALPEQAGKSSGREEGCMPCGR
jgi:membrane protein implicated in regulation of membrane protease activity